MRIDPRWFNSAFDGAREQLQLELRDGCRTAAGNVSAPASYRYLFYRYLFYRYLFYVPSVLYTRTFLGNFGTVCVNQLQWWGIASTKSRQCFHPVKQNSLQHKKCFQLTVEAICSLKDSFNSLKIYTSINYVDAIQILQIPMISNFYLTCRNHLNSNNIALIEIDKYCCRRVRFN